MAGCPGARAAPGWPSTWGAFKTARPGCSCLPGAGLVMWVLESTSIAVDQWYGHAAAPASPVASGALVPAFAVLAVIGLIPAGLLLHGLSGGLPGVTAAPRLPV